MTSNQICLKKNHYAEQQHRLLRRTTTAMQNRPGKKNHISLLICLVFSVHDRYIAKTKCFIPIHILVPQRRRYPKSTGQKLLLPWLTSEHIQSPSPFHISFRDTLVSPTAYSSLSKSAHARLFSTSKPSPPPTFVPTKTRYTIDDSVCLPTTERALEKSVHKACRSLEVYMEKKPIVAHTRHAFEVLVEMIDEDKKRRQSSSSSLLPSTRMMYDGIILDSGCGTGRSTKLLASSIHPKHLVIGVDRSFARLTKTKDNKQVNNDSSNNTESVPEGSVYCHQVAENAYLVQAELVDFWRCCVEHGWTTQSSEPAETRNENFEGDNDNQHDEYYNGLKITHHYMLYPNPYPKSSRLSSRWYAHPSFPLILKLGVQTMIVRSNWEGYLTEFGKAVEMASEFYIRNSNEEDYIDIENIDGKLRKIATNLALPYIDSAKKGPMERIDKAIAFTNFESKYDTVGEPTYELILERKDSTEQKGVM